MRAGERMRLEAAGYMVAGYMAISIQEYNELKAAVAAAREQTNPIYLLPNLRAKDLEIEGLKIEIKVLKAANNILRIANDILHRRRLEKAK